MSTNKDWQKLQDFQNENKQLLIMIADPKTDEISISFNNLNTFVKFPMESMDKGVVFNVLRKSKFNVSIDAFMTGIINSIGVDEKDKDGNELYKVLGGSVKALGIETQRSKLEVIKKSKNGKKNK